MWLRVSFTTISSRKNVPRESCTNFEFFAWQRSRCCWSSCSIHFPFPLHWTSTVLPVVSICTDLSFFFLFLELFSSLCYQWDVFYKLTFLHQKLFSRVTDVIWYLNVFVSRPSIWRKIEMWVYTGLERVGSLSTMTTDTTKCLLSAASPSWHCVFRFINSLHLHLLSSSICSEILCEGYQLSASNSARLSVSKQITFVYLSKSVK